MSVVRPFFRFFFRELWTGPVTEPVGERGALSVLVASGGFAMYVWTADCSGSSAGKIAAYAGRAAGTA